MKKRMLSLVLAGAMCFGLAACGSTGSSNGTSTETTQAADTAATSDEAEPAETVADKAKVQEKGTLVVGITDFEPMDYKDADGNWIGFDADMANAFAESLGVKAEFVEIEWDNKILELNAGNIDCVWNGMTLTEEVTSSMD